MPKNEQLLPSTKATDGGQSEAISADVVQQMLAQNARSLDLREKELEHEREHERGELELRKTQADHNHEIAVKSIEAQERFTDRYMTHARKINWPKFVIGGVGVAGIIAISIISLYLNKEDFAKALVEKVAYVAVSLWGGYQWGKNAARRNRPENSGQPDDPTD